MELEKTKTFPFSMDTAWDALHKASSLDVEPGSTADVISDTEWISHTYDNAGKERTSTHYIASFDDDAKLVTIEGTSNAKHAHDFIYLQLKEEADAQVSLDVKIEINLGMNLVAKAMVPFIKKHSEQIITKQIFSNFEALCSGKETKAMTSEELDDYAKDAARKHFTK